MTENILQDKCRGSLVGGAVGDALGYEVEFMSLSAILRQFGEKGMTRYVMHNGIAEFSDDTQMSLFTAEGILVAYAYEKMSEDELRSHIRAGYEHWYATQTRVPYPLTQSWLTHIAALWSERAPGMTCMSALRHIAYGDGSPVENNSKGCGGVMRVAPIGIFASAHPDVMDLNLAYRIAGIAADITHKHPLSTLSSMALAMIVAECIAEDYMDRDKFKFIIFDKIFKVMRIDHPDDKNLQFLEKLTSKAIGLAESDNSDMDAIKMLGQGWVAEETLAIAVFSVMRYIDDFQKCIVCAVNHDGDSDSTGAVAGNIIGAILGYSKIPLNYLTTLELKDVLVSVADDLCGCSTDEQMMERYKNHQPFGVNPGYLIG